jgi:hypothetical protein
MDLLRVRKLSAQAASVCPLVALAGLLWMSASIEHSGTAPEAVTLLISGLIGTVVGVATLLATYFEEGRRIGRS